MLVRCAVCAWEYSTACSLLPCDCSYPQTFVADRKADFYCNSVLLSLYGKLTSLAPPSFTLKGQFLGGMFDENKYYYEMLVG